MTANALKDRCRFSNAGGAAIEPGSPWQDPYVELFDSRVREQLLTVELFACLAETKVFIENWTQDYNRRWAHSAPAMKPPARFVRAWRAQHDPVAVSPRSPHGLTSRDGATPTLRQNRLSQQVDP